jgi:hypothetical protein
MNPTPADKCRISNVEGMYSVYFIKRVSEAIPSFDIRHSTFFGSAVRFLTLCSFIQGFRGSDGPGYGFDNLER